MLKRNKMLVAFMLVAVLCMSIGFAAVSDTLNTSGTYGIVADNDQLASQFAENIYFSAVSNSTEMVISNGTDAAADKDDVLTITVPANTLNIVGDKYTVTATVKNDNTSTAAISVGTITNSASEYVTATVTAAGNATEIAGNGTLVYTIVLTMVKAPSTDIDANFSFDITATAND